MATDELASRFATADAELPALRADAEARVVTRRYATGTNDDPMPLYFEGLEELEIERDVWLPDVTSPQGGVTEHGYDIDGRLVHRIAWNKVEPEFVNFEVIWKWGETTVEEYSYSVGTIEQVGIGTHEAGRIQELRQQTSAGTQTWTFEWQDGRCIRATVLPPFASTPRTLEATYDGDDTLVGASWANSPLTDALEPAFGIGTFFRPHLEGEAHAIADHFCLLFEDPPMSGREFSAALASQGVLDADDGTLEWQVLQWQPTREGGQRYDEFVAWISDAGPFPQLGELYLRNDEHGRHVLGDQSVLWRTFPALRRLDLEGNLDDLGTIDHTTLEDLDLRIACSSSLPLHQLGAAQLPVLRSLTLAFDDHADDDPTFEGLDALLEPQWPALRHVSIGGVASAAHLRVLLAGLIRPQVCSLALLGVTLDAALIDLLVGSGVLPQLRFLQLGYHRRDHDAADRLAAIGSLLAHIERCRVIGDSFTPAQIEALTYAVPGLEHDEHLGILTGVWLGVFDAP